MFCFVAQLALTTGFLVLATAAHAGEFWSDSKSCENIDLDNVTITRYAAIHKQGIHGVVRYRGEEPIRDLKVCAGNSCTVIFAGVAMQKGQSAEFLLTVDNLDPVTLTVECEVFE
jgi:hypothetical protein